MRLKALADAPEAFQTSLGEALKITDTEWEERARRGAESETAAYFLAVEAGRCCGMVGSVFTGDHRADAEMISLWVDPLCRRKGIGKALIEAVVAWARGGGAVSLHLGVREANVQARRLYATSGFVEGPRQSHGATGGTCEVGMRLALR